MAENIKSTSSSIYDIVVKDMNGNDVNLSSYKGKVLLIVNVASKCELTPSNYKQMNALYAKYTEQGFEILAFPCNQFLGQEPGDNTKIKAVCSWYEAEFSVFDKIEVNGKKSAPLYKFLKTQKGGIFGSCIKWNFTKFLVSRDGDVSARYSPICCFMKMEKDIKKILNAN